MFCTIHVGTLQLGYFEMKGWILHGHLSKIFFNAT